MKPLVIFISMFILSACSVFRHKTENRSSQKDLAVHMVRRSDSLQMTAQAQRIRFLSDDRLELTEIIPEGKFVYRPDSGFKGEAGRVRIYRQLQQRAVEKDTGAVRLTGTSHQANAGSTLHEQVRQQLKDTKKLEPVPLWVYALAMPVLLAMGFLWKKR